MASKFNSMYGDRWKGFLPYFPDASYEVLVKLAEIQADRLKELRHGLFKRGRELNARSDVGLEAKILTSEIEDAFRRMEELMKNEGNLTDHSFESLRLPDIMSDMPYAPLFILHKLGRRWYVDTPYAPHSLYRFRPQKGDAVGDWLSPPSAGWERKGIKLKLL